MVMKGEGSSLKLDVRPFWRVGLKEGGGRKLGQTENDEAAEKSFSTRRKDVRGRTYPR